MASLDLTTSTSESIIRLAMIKNNLKYIDSCHLSTMLTLSCRDVGRDCDCVVEGETEEELIKNAGEHAMKDHGYKQEDIITPEMKERIKSHIRRF
jgi:predicted small metal-binding protein